MIELDSWLPDETGEYHVNSILPKFQTRTPIELEIAQTLMVELYNRGHVSISDETSTLSELHAQVESMQNNMRAFLSNYVRANPREDDNKPEYNALIIYTSDRGNEWCKLTDEESLQQLFDYCTSSLHSPSPSIGHARLSESARLKNAFDYFANASSNPFRSAVDLRNVVLTTLEGFVARQPSIHDNLCLFRAFKKGEQMDSIVVPVISTTFDYKMALNFAQKHDDCIIARIELSSGMPALPVVGVRPIEKEVLILKDECYNNQSTFITLLCVNNSKQIVDVNRKWTETRFTFEGDSSKETDLIKRIQCIQINYTPHQGGGKASVPPPRSRSR